MMIAVMAPQPVLPPWNSSTATAMSYTMSTVLSAANAKVASAEPSRATRFNGSALRHPWKSLGRVYVPLMRVVMPVAPSCKAKLRAGLS